VDGVAVPAEFPGGTVQRQYAFTCHNVGFTHSWRVVFRAASSASRGRGGLRYVPAQAGLFGGGLPGSSPQRGLGWVFIQPQKRQRQENSTHAAGKHHRMLQAYVKPPA